MIASPAYNGQVNVEFMTSLLELQKQVSFEFFTVPFDSLIPRARNHCVSHFLESNCTHLLFIDADIQFKPSDVMKMLKFDLGMVCGIYPKKSLCFENIDKPRTYEELLKQSVCFNYNSFVERVNEDVIEVKEAATGFMLLEKWELIAYVHENKIPTYFSDIGAYGSKIVYDIFQCGVHNNRYLSEDYYFCMKWRESKRKVFVYTKCVLNHIGRMQYIGCLENNLKIS